MKQRPMLRGACCLAALSWSAVANKLRTSHGELNTAELEGYGCKTHKCSDGWFPKDFIDHHIADKGDASDVHCCVKTCKLWNCSAGFIPNKLYEANVQSTDGISNDQICCDKQCGEWSCDDGWDQTEEMKLGPGLTHNECCGKLCVDFSCTGNWSKPGDQAKRYGNSSEVCCEPSCATWNCTDDWIQDEQKFPLLATSNDVCCQESCAMHRCPDGYDVHESKLGDPVNLNCCDPTCAVYMCTYGYEHHSDPNVSKKVAFTDEECCERVKTCLDYACDPSKGWANHTKYDHIWIPEENIDETCCEPACNTWNCSSGLVHSYASYNEAGQSDEECCETPCDTHICSYQNMLLPEPEKLPGKTDEACCEPKKCSKVQCSASMPKKPLVDDLVGWEDDFCCEPEECAVVRNTKREVEVGGCNAVSEEDCDKRFFQVNPPNRSRIVIECKLTDVRGAVVCSTEGKETLNCGDMGREHGMHCSFYMCPYEMALRTNAADIFGNTTEDCCEETCASYTCKNEENILKNDARKIRNPSEEECCEPKTCAVVNCSVSNPRKPNVENIVSHSEDVCCEPDSCANLRLARDEVKAADGGCEALDVKTCRRKFMTSMENGSLQVTACKWEETACAADGTVVVGCGDMTIDGPTPPCSLYLCPFEHPLKKDAYNIFGQSEEECCQMEA
eukprot:gb/GFBE01005128.1/.p1 GENE.gb/GFBE01005128.1/~~gb/GFBE01005128.1/.p1  ORF type:complete len:675 (+),score=154.73 gb/GFBE01005128.1/:1-2025(+)